MRVGKCRIVVIVGVLGVIGMSGCGGGVSREGKRAWEEGCEAYLQTNYAKAVRLYRKAEELGYAPGALYYNLGNAYYRLGEVGRAISAYRRAQWLMPRDGDVLANLGTARRAAKEQLGMVGPPAAVQGFLFFYYHVSPDEALWVFMVVTVVLSLGMGVQAFVKRSGLRQVLVVVGVVWVVMGSSAGVHAYRMLEPRDGVVIAERAEVRSGPSERETVIFELHDGAEVEVLSREGDWCKIKAGAQKGWIAARDIEMITIRRR
ncbi:MAG: SH3 domain-containing protein [bacterium]|nr:SH3 domain-containing protein [bacterium]